MYSASYVNLLLLFMFALPEPPVSFAQINNVVSYAKASFPVTRGYLKNTDVKPETVEDNNLPKTKKRIKKIIKKKGFRKGSKIVKMKRNFAGTNGPKKISNDKEPRFSCSICKKKKYKYRRNKLRHEKYECITGPQFACEKCGKKYSQKKTLTSHIALKHPDWLKEETENWNCYLTFVNFL